MESSRRRKYPNRSSNAVWHIESTCKLVNYKFIVSGAVDRHSSYIMCLKCPNNNKVTAACRLYKEAITNRIVPLQARRDKGCENKIITKSMVTLSRL